MAWTMSVRPRRRRATSVLRRIILEGIDIFAPHRPIARIVLRTSQLALQIALLIAAFAHITAAPVLAALAIIGALAWFASSDWLGWRDLANCAHATSTADTTAAVGTGHHGIEEIAQYDAETATHSGSASHAVAAQSFPGSVHQPFSRIAPANDANAWTGLCARLSHELRTPLNAVLGFSELMKDELHGPLCGPRYREYVSHIRESGRALLKSTEDTLAITELLSGSHFGSPATLPIEPLLADVWHFLEPIAQARSISLDMNVPAELEILGDHRTLRQAIINLLEEAIGHAADGGVIRISATPARSFVDLDISAGTRKAARLADTLSIHLVRALLDISGAKLDIRTEPGKWQARTLLDRATQPDFFEGFGTQAAVG